MRAAHRSCLFSTGSSRTAARRTGDRPRLAALRTRAGARAPSGRRGPSVGRCPSRGASSSAATHRRPRTCGWIASRIADAGPERGSGAARPASATSCAHLGPTGRAGRRRGSSRPMLERCDDARTRSERWRNRSVRRRGLAAIRGLELEHRARWGDGQLVDQAVPLLREGGDLLVEGGHLGGVALVRGVGVLSACCTREFAAMTDRSVLSVVTTGRRSPWRRPPGSRRSSAWRRASGRPVMPAAAMA